jgi:hypothetical protein
LKFTTSSWHMFRGKQRSGGKLCIKSNIGIL